MAKFLLSLHVLVSVLFIGPVAVAVSMFPRRAKAALAGGADQASDAGVLRVLHRITQVYALLGVAVPVLGIGLAQVMDVIGQSWLIVSMVLTAIAALALLLFVLPGQQAAVDALDLDPADERRTKAVGGLRLLPMTAGVFNLLWAVVVVLMVVRPGSSTGV
ncbi:hypothetical protein BX285_2597 [Streptomyces sp. 1114.5]|uniref:hypothetical protein n=1 Tax=Streptomyces sp. 1114.5 TaxID=1938830 RepID=UPI000EAB560D|nr:hypothetical protein [Streptomyces sp. 1114.5]RKT18180.1 hypothetical protein BX285_2597 [Streptomyces sp. 1114.5]